MKPHRANEQGFALAAAVLAVVMVGALVSAGFYAASREGDSGRSNVNADEALYVAEQGLNTVLATFTRDQAESFSGTETTVSGTVELGSEEIGTYDVTIRRIGDHSLPLSDPSRSRLYFLESTGVVTRGGRYAGATRRIGSAVRTLNLAISTNQALQTYGGTNVQGAATISGSDEEPTAWNGEDCDPPKSDVSGVTARDASTVTGKTENISGDPPVAEDAAMDESDFNDFGDVNYSQLAGLANVKLPGGTSLVAQPTLDANGACETGNDTNWGEPLDPTHACYDYFPIIHVAGDLEMANGNGRGQGILLVDGDMQVAGTFEFYGVIIVKGQLNNQGGGTAELHGTVMTFNDALLDEADNELVGNPQIQFSTCAVERSISENAVFNRFYPVLERSWMDLSAAGVDS